MKKSQLWMALLVSLALVAPVARAQVIYRAEPIPESSYGIVPTEFSPTPNSALIRGSLADGAGFVSVRTPDNYVWLYAAIWKQGTPTVVNPNPGSLFGCYFGGTGVGKDSDFTGCQSFIYFQGTIYRDGHYHTRVSLNGQWVNDEDIRVYGSFPPALVNLATGERRTFVFGDFPNCNYCDGIGNDGSAIYEVWNSFSRTWEPYRWDGRLDVQKILMDSPLNVWHGAWLMDGKAIIACVSYDGNPDHWLLSRLTPVADKPKPPPLKVIDKLGRWKAVD